MKTKYKAFLLAAFLFGLGSLIAYGAGLLFVDDSGNFGIGNTTPQHKLDVSGAFYSRLVTLTAGDSVTANWNNGNVQMLTLDRSSTTLTFSNGQAGGEYKLILKQDATGGRAVVWPDSIKWPGGTVPVLTTSANATDIIGFVYAGADYLGSYSLNHKSGPITIFSDNFNRSNASSWGSPSDGSSAWSNASGGSAISSNTGTITGTNGQNTPTNYHSISQQNNLTITFTMKNWAAVTSGSVRFFQVRSNGGNRDGWGLTIFNGSSGNINLDDNGTNKATGNFTFTTGHDYKVGLDITSGNGINAYIWDTTGSKPSSPNLSQGDWTPSTSGTNWEMGNSDASATVLIVDDLVIQAN